MCGIIGYAGSEPVTPILLDGLAHLEYRGYDSAGVAVVEQDQSIRVVKSKGRLSVLSDLLDQGAALPGSVGIGHTRWATHGRPSDDNAHPHTSVSGKFAVVHNGIIENYQKLKEFLLEKGVVFTSETDSEVVAQLIEYYYQGDLFQALREVLHRVEGSYALGILCTDTPDQIMAVRKDSPLIVGLSGSGNFIASDVPAILSRTRDIYYLNDNEIVVLTKDQVQVFTLDHEPVQKEVCHIDWNASAAEKGGYEHFMFKEIMEQPHVFGETVNARIKDGEIVLEGVDLSAEVLKQLDRIFIVACGSAYHAGVVGKYVLEKLLRKPVETLLASEFRYSDPLVDEHSLVIIVSQSGETADTLAALRESKRLGAQTLAIVNVVGSSIANEADHVLYTWAGPEIAVATTKGYTTQLAVLYLIALHCARQLGTISPVEYSRILEALQGIPAKMEQILSDTKRIQYFASKFFSVKNVFFIGRNLDYAASLEACLKLKEISYIHSEAYAAGELKHGPISLIEDGTLVVAFATCDPLFDKLMSNVKEVKARGAVVLAVVKDSKYYIENDIDATLFVPETHGLLMPCLTALPMQLFAYYVAALKGCDIDKPRNLAKSVTVECVPRRRS